MGPDSSRPDSILLIGLLLLLSFFFVFSALGESAICGMTRARVKRLADRSPAAASKLHDFVDRPDPYLTTTRLVKLASLLGLTVIASEVVAARWPSPPFLIVWAGAVVVAAVGGWVIPRAIAARWPERVALGLVTPLRAMTWLLSPVSRLVTAMTDRLSMVLGGRENSDGPVATPAELKEIVAASEEEGLLERRERTMIDNILGLENVTVREIMVPRLDIMAVPSKATVREAVEIFTREGYSRLPLYGESIDDVVGVLYGKDLFPLVLQERLDDSVGGYARPAYFVPESKKSDDLLRELQQQRVHIALVVDEYGGTAGLVTIEDLLEEIVGEIQDEFDTEEQRIVREADGAAIVDGAVSIDDVNDVLGLNLTTEEVESIGGLVYEKLGRVPIAGDTIAVDGATLTVIAAHRRRVTRVRVRRLDLASDEPMPAARSAGDNET